MNLYSFPSRGAPYVRCRHRRGQTDLRYRHPPAQRQVPHARQACQKEISRTVKAIKEHINNDPDLRQRKDLLVSIDGIGDKTAALLLGELGNPLEFDDAKAVVAFAGLNPKLHESGAFKGQTRISRIGSAFLRSGLYMPALVAMQHNCAIKALKERLKARGKSGKQIVCAAMRKLLHIVYGVLKSGRPFDPKLALAR